MLAHLKMKNLRKQGKFRRLWIGESGKEKNKENEGKKPATNIASPPDSVNGWVMRSAASIVKVQAKEKKSKKKKLEKIQENIVLKIKSEEILSKGPKEKHFHIIFSYKQ